MTAFVRSGNLADKLLEFRQSSGGAILTLPRGRFRHTKVRVLPSGKSKTLLAIESTTARDTHFETAHHGKISVEDFFLKGNFSFPHLGDLIADYLCIRTQPKTQVPHRTPLSQSR